MNQAAEMYAQQFIVANQLIPVAPAEQIINTLKDAHINFPSHSFSEEYMRGLSKAFQLCEFIINESTTSTKQP